MPGIQTPSQNRVTNFQSAPQNIKSKHFNEDEEKEMEFFFLI